MRACLCVCAWGYGLLVCVAAQLRLQLSVEVELLACFCSSLLAPPSCSGPAVGWPHVVRNLGGLREDGSTLLLQPAPLPLHRLARHKDRLAALMKEWGFKDEATAEAFLRRQQRVTQVRACVCACTCVYVRASVCVWGGVREWVGGWVGFGSCARVHEFV